MGVENPFLAVFKIERLLGQVVNLLGIILVATYDAYLMSTDIEIRMGFKEIYLLL